MALTEQIQKDLVEAMRAKDELRLAVLRMAKTALKNRQVEKMRALEEAEEVQVLLTLIKQRREAAEQFAAGGRAEMAERETQEITVLESYLPAAATPEEMKRAIGEAIAETGADSMKQMGAVVKAARARLAGKTVDGKALSDLVRERLSGRG